MKSSLTTAGVIESKRFALWQDAVCETFVQLDCEPVSNRPFVGEIVTAQAGEVNFSRVRSREHKVFRTPQRIRQANQETILVSLQLSGTGWVWQDGREARLESGDFACHDSTRPYSLSFTDDFEQLVLHMPREILVRRIGQTEHFTARPVRATSPIGAVISPFLHQLASGVADFEPVTARRLSEISLALITTAFGELVAQQEKGQSWARTSLLYRAKALIEENLHDPSLSPENVARALRISLRYLQDLFHSEKTTVSNWIWSRRLEKCRRDLSDPLLSSKDISQIAFDCGFSDFAHFSRRYKAEFLVSPSEFRREQRTRAILPPGNPASQSPH